MVEQVEPRFFPASILPLSGVSDGFSEQSIAGVVPTIIFLTAHQAGRK